MIDQAPIVIVGTGLSGYSLAREIRKRDSEVPIIMITADDGISYSKPMLSTGFSKGKDAEGLAQADTDTMAQQLNVEIRAYTTVTGIDTENHQLFLGEQRLNYGQLILAWGADVARPALAGDGLARVYSINDLVDYRAFRKALPVAGRVAIMGAGLIGCEFANDLRNGSFQVDVIAPDDQVMPSLLPAPAAAAVQNELAGLGVRFHLGRLVERVDQQDRGVRLTLNDGSVLEADLVISAIGLRPRTELARAAGIRVGLGIQVNRALETSAQDVFALGDCAEVDGRVLLYVLPLMAGARALARTLTGERSEVRYGTMPVMVKTPCCPTAVCPPPAGADGEWQCHQEGNNVKALFQSPQGEALGFAVTGRFAVEKQTLARMVPPIHQE